MDAPKGMRKVEVERFNGLKKSLENQSGEESNPIKLRWLNYPELELTRERIADVIRDKGSLYFEMSTDVDTNEEYAHLLMGEIQSQFKGSLKLSKVSNILFRLDLED